METKKRSVICRMKCSKCKKEWQTPGMWNETFSVISLLRNNCPCCDNWKKNHGFDITNKPENAELPLPD